MNSVQQTIDSKSLESKDMEVINSIDNGITTGFLQVEQRIEQYESAPLWPPLYSIYYSDNLFVKSNIRPDFNKINSFSEE